MFTVLFFKCYGKKYFILDENDHDKVGAECILKKKQKLEQVYYYFNSVDLNTELQ